MCKRRGEPLLKLGELTANAQWNKEANFRDTLWITQVPSSTVSPLSMRSIPAECRGATPLAVLSGFVCHSETVDSVFSPRFLLLLPYLTSFSFFLLFSSFFKQNRKQQRNRKKCSTLKEVVAPWISRSGCTKSTMDPKTWSVKTHTGLHVLKHHGWAS